MKMFCLFIILLPCVLWSTNPSLGRMICSGETLSLGNGSLGAMVYGDVAVDRIQLNEEGIWSGGSQDSYNLEALKAKKALEDLLADGKYAEAQKLDART